MTKLKLYYDGWLVLPPSLRRQLDLSTGAVLEAELIDGTIVLRPRAVAQGVTATAPEQEASEPHTPGALPAPELAAPTKRKPGRPRKVPVGEQLQLMPSGMQGDALRLTQHEPELKPETSVAEPSAPMAKARRPRGRPRKVAVAPEIEPASLADIDAHSELRRKVMLPSAIHEHGPVRGRRSGRAVPSSGYEREERRPFARVEVRKLGPGRGHNRPRGSQSQA